MKTLGFILMIPLLLLFIFGGLKTIWNLFVESPLLDRIVAITIFLFSIGMILILITL